MSYLNLRRIFCLKLRLDAFWMRWSSCSVMERAWKLEPVMYLFTPPLTNLDLCGLLIVTYLALASDGFSFFFLQTISNQSTFWYLLLQQLSLCLDLSSFLLFSFTFSVSTYPFLVLTFGIDLWLFSWPKEYYSSSTHCFIWQLLPN